MAEYSQSLIHYQHAIPLGAVIRKTSASNSGAVNVLGYWNYVEETWETEFDAKRHVQRLQRLSPDPQGHDYKSQAFAAPIKAFAEQSAFVTFYLLEDGQPKDVWITEGRSAIGIHANLGW